MWPPVALSLLLTACQGTGGDSGTVEVDAPWPYTVVGTDQTRCYDESGEIDCPAEGEDCYGQDGQYVRYEPSYLDNGDDTVTDRVTGLVWQWEQLDDVAWEDAEATCEALDLGGRDDWRVPDVKELYSLIQFDGCTGTAEPDSTETPEDAEPYLDSEVFDFAYGDTDSGHRYIDSQYISSNLYESTAFSDDEGLEPGEECFFGVNFADGRIKCYPTERDSDHEVGRKLRCVSGDEYGENDFEDGGDGTVVDYATGLMWLQQDSGHYGAGPDGDGALDWSQALAWCEALEEAGYDDWRLPDAKELQSIVDYTRSPDTTDSAAIDPLFETTGIVNEAGDDDFGYYWTSSTHLDGEPLGGSAAYVAFGQALGYYEGSTTGEQLYLDVHGAGAQRSDPKVGDPEDYPQAGQGPQGDVQRVFNYARCVREFGD